MASITLFRHSISQANEAGICDSGRFDAPLSEQGRNLARIRAAEVAQCPDAIYTSDMNRARESAEIFRDALQEKFGRDIPLITHSGLRGQDLGNLEGLSLRSQEFQLLSIMADRNGIESFGGESLETSCRRQMKAFGEVAESALRSGLKNTLVFTHSDAIMCLQMEMRRQPSQLTIPKNCQGVGPFDAEQIAQEFGARRQAAKKPAPPKTPGLR